MLGGVLWKHTEEAENGTGSRGGNLGQLRKTYSAGRGESKWDLWEELKV